MWPAAVALLQSMPKLELEPSVAAWSTALGVLLEAEGF